MARNFIQFIRGRDIVKLDGVGATQTLLDYLRLQEGKKGTKEGCAEGDCGACTVVLGSLKNGKLVYEAVNACILLLGQIDGKHLVTIEDLSADGSLHPVQQAMVDFHGSQCGFCTPGIVMSLFALYQEQQEQPQSQNLRMKVLDSLSGNLCRCTGYRPIMDAALSALNLKQPDFLIAMRNEIIEKLVDIDDGEDIEIAQENGWFCAPATVESLADYYLQHPDAVLVSGATDVGLWITKQLREIPKIIYLGRILALHEIVKQMDHIEIGAAATYCEVQEVLSDISPDLDELLRRIGSRQVRASGTVGGNIANGSPIGDTPPALIALNATLHLRKGDESRTLPLEEFFIDYGKQDRADGEFVEKITIPKPNSERHHFKCFKVSKRYDQDISSVMGAFFFDVDDGKVKQARIAFGGMAATPRRAKGCESCFEGQRLEDDVIVSKAVSALASDYAPISDVRSSAQYRTSIAQNLLKKAVYELTHPDGDATRLHPMVKSA